MWNTRHLILGHFALYSGTQILGHSALYFGTLYISFWDTLHKMLGHTAFYIIDTIHYTLRQRALYCGTQGHKFWAPLQYIFGTIYILFWNNLH